MLLQEKIEQSKKKVESHYQLAEELLTCPIIAETSQIQRTQTMCFGAEIKKKFNQQMNNKEARRQSLQLEASKASQ